METSTAMRMADKVLFDLADHIHGAESVHALRAIEYNLAALELDTLAEELRAARLLFSVTRRHEVIRASQVNAKRAPGYHLGDFTPFKDRRGVRIRIGDVLKFDEREWGGRKEFTMTFNNETWEWSNPGSASDLENWCEVIHSTLEKFSGP